MCFFQERDEFFPVSLGEGDPCGLFPFTQCHIAKDGTSLQDRDLVVRTDSTFHFFPPVFNRIMRCSMLFNTEYFRVLCQSESISAAAEKLHVSHQNLSRYIRNLEQQYRTVLFTRTPKLALTEAGRAVLDSMQEIAIAEQNLQTRLQEIRRSDVGSLRVGAPEGRFRIVLPGVLAALRQEYPGVAVCPVAAPSSELQKKQLRNEIDVALIDGDFVDPVRFRQWSVMEETLSFVISDRLLRRHLGKLEAADLARFRQGIDIREFLALPFILNLPNSISRRCLDRWLRAHDRQIRPVMELSQMDVHILLSACGYGACFCWSMYLPLVEEQNLLHRDDPLYVFPLKDFPDHNRIVLASLKQKTLPSFGKRYCSLIRERYASLALPASFK